MTIRYAIITILILPLLVDYGYARKRHDNKLVNTNYVIDPEVLKAHEARFGRSSFERKWAEDSRGRLKHVVVPVSRIPSLVNTEPGEKNLEITENEILFEIPILPKFPEDVPYKPTIVKLNSIFTSLIPTPSARIFKWGKTDKVHRGPTR